MKKLYILLLLILIIQFSILAQNTQSNDWIRIETENKEISFALPKDYFHTVDKDGFYLFNPTNWNDKLEYKNVRSVSAFENGATVFFESYDSGSSKRGLEYFLSLYSDGKYQKLNFDIFNGLMISQDKDLHSTFYYFASSKNTYLIGFGSREKNNPVVNKFLSSILLNGKQVFNSSLKYNFPAQAENISNLQENQIDISYDIIKDEKKTKTDKNPPKSTPNPNQKSVIVFFKPRAGYTDNARRSGEQGKLQLRVGFEQNGKISKMIVVKDLKNGLVEQAIRAVKRMRFVPAENNNVQLSVVKTVEYQFTLY